MTSLGTPKTTQPNIKMTCIYHDFLSAWNYFSFLSDSHYQNRTEPGFSPLFLHTMPETHKMFAQGIYIYIYSVSKNAEPPEGNYGIQSNVLQPTTLKSPAAGDL